MLKKFILILFMFFITLQANAFEDYIITTNGKLTDIKIEDNMIVDVCPLVTIMNKKNTLIVRPLKTGTTRFTVKKNNKENFIFHVYIEADKTIISEVKGFEILAIDTPPKKEELYLDLPPKSNSVKEEE